MPPLRYVLDVSLRSLDWTRATKNYFADASFQNFVAGNELNRNYTTFWIFLDNKKNNFFHITAGWRLKFLWEILSYSAPRRGQPPPRQPPWKNFIPHCTPCFMFYLIEKFKTLRSWCCTHSLGWFLNAPLKSPRITRIWQFRFLQALHPNWIFVGCLKNSTSPNSGCYIQFQIFLFCAS